MKLYAQSKIETPLYQQLHDQIVSQIVAGTVEKDYCLPSIRLVARELQISVIPVKAAYDLLEQEGYIYTVPGKGCFVAQVATEKQSDLACEKMTECIRYCRSLGMSDNDILDLAKTSCKSDD